MSTIDITSDFLSYVQDSHINFNSSWNTSIFIKSSNAALQEMSVLQSKLKELKKIIKASSRYDKEKNNKMIMNLKESIKIREQTIKKLAIFQPDIKGSYKLAKSFKDSVLSALQLRLLKVSFQFKQAYEQNCIKGRPSLKKNFKNDSTINEPEENAINLNKSHFLSQTQEQLIQQASIKQYKQIQKSMNEIFEMYKSSNDAVILQGYMIDSIQNNVSQIDENVTEGKKNISEVHRRQSKNRNIILKMFAALYFITFVYIVFLS